MLSATNLRCHEEVTAPLPLRNSPTEEPDPITPYIYSTKEIKALLAGTTTYARECGKLRADTFRVLLLTLFATGLRLGEALRLRISDVDLRDSLLIIHESKFFKTRLVPIPVQLTKELTRFYTQRKRRPCPDGNDSTFFSTVDGHGLTVLNVERRFRKLREHVGIFRDGGPRSQPRMHDLRHGYALRRLISWYRQGADVQLLLPVLSTYLGHVNIAATQRYLTLTPDLLREASVRFEQYVQEGTQ